MQIYTKILIGMALGIIAGFTVGPKSAFLVHDLLLIEDPSALKLLSQPGGNPIGVALPKLAQGEKRPLRASIVNRRGHGDTEYVEVRFDADDRLVLADRTGRLRHGQEIKGWIAQDPSLKQVSGFGSAFWGVLEPIGQLFMKLIKMIIVPLVFASLLVGVTSLGDMRRLGRLGGKALGYFLTTTVLAIVIGLALANIVRPGDFVSPEDKKSLVEQYSKAATDRAMSAADKPSAVENLLKIIPENPVRSMADGEMLQVIFFAAFLGIALTLLPSRRAQPVIDFFVAINDGMIVIVDIIMKIAPYGVFALVAKVVGESGLSVVKALGVYALVVFGGLMVHAFAVYTSVVRFFGKIPVVEFWRAIRPAQLIAFSTSSSSATLPVTMDCAERRLGISNQVAAFVLPLGSTVNMDGTALYQGVAAVFVAQVFDIPLGIGDQINIVLTATLASVGAAGVPGAGMIILALVLTSIGVPTVGVALILGVDRILDMFRTAINVTGDCSAAVMVATTEGEKLGRRAEQVEAEPVEEQSTAPRRRSADLATGEKAIIDKVREKQEAAEHPRRRADDRLPTAELDTARPLPSDGRIVIDALKKETQAEAEAESRDDKPGERAEKWKVRPKKDPPESD